MRRPRIDDAVTLARSAIGYEDALWATRRARVTDGGDRGASARDRSRCLGTDSGRQGRLRYWGPVSRPRWRVRLVFAGRSAEGLAASARGVASAREAGDDTALAHAYLAERVVRPGPESLTARLAASTAAWGTAPAYRRRNAGARGAQARADRLPRERGHGCGWTPRSRASQTSSTIMRQPLYLWYPPMWRTMRALLAGRLVEADLLLEAFEDMGHRWRYRDVEAVATAQAFLLRREQGRLPEIRDRIDSMSTSRGATWLPMIASPACRARSGRLRGRRSRRGVPGRWLSLADWARPVVGSHDAGRRLDHAGPSRPCCGDIRATRPVGRPRCGRGFGRRVPRSRRLLVGSAVGRDGQLDVGQTSA